MSWFDRMMVVTLAALAIATAFAVVLVVASQPQANAQVRNAYWPYSVETVIRDR